MSENTNSHDHLGASVTLPIVNLVPDPANPGYRTYAPADPGRLGEHSPQISIKVLEVGPPPHSGDYSQGLPKDQPVNISQGLFEHPKDACTHVLVDTGSWNTILPASMFCKAFQAQLDKYPRATIGYSSNPANAGEGRWVPMRIALIAADGSQAVTTIPVVVQTSGGSNQMMGVGFNIGRGLPGTEVDTSPYANAFLNLDGMVDGSMARTYVIDGNGFHIGVNRAAMGENWAMQKLQPSARTVPDGAPPDWQAATIGGSLHYPAQDTQPARTVTISPSGLLMDTGVTKTFISTHDGLTAPNNGSTVSLDLFGTGGAVGYTYTLGGSSPMQPTAGGHGQALNAHAPGEGRHNLFNTGVHLLSGLDYMYDADGGYVGVRPNATLPDGAVRFAPLIAVSGEYPMPDGFRATVPLHLTGDTRLDVSGTATLSGGIGGTGVLQLVKGTLVLSGEAGGARVALGNGTTLRVPGSLSIGKLQFQGTATLDIAAGAMVTTGTLAGPEGLDPRVTLSVTGGGTLRCGERSVESGHSIGFDIVADPDAAEICALAPGDLMEGTGLGAGSGLLVAGHDAATHRVPLAGEERTAQVHLASRPSVNTHVTVDAGGRGGAPAVLVAPEQPGEVEVPGVPPGACTVVCGNGGGLHPAAVDDMLLPAPGDGLPTPTCTDVCPTVAFGTDGNGRMTFLTEGKGESLTTGRGADDGPQPSSRVAMFGGGEEGPMTGIGAGSSVSTLLEAAIWTSRFLNPYDHGQLTEGVPVQGSAGSLMVNQQSLAGGTVPGLSYGDVSPLVSVHQATSGLFP